MTKNDITRGLIDFAVSQCLKNIKEDPYRSIRRLADLGRQFAKGRFQEELFSLFQRLACRDLPFSGKLCLPVKRTALRRPEKWYLRVPSPSACPEHYHRHQTTWAYPRIS